MKKMTDNPLSISA